VGDDASDEHFHRQKQTKKRNECSDEHFHSNRQNEMNSSRCIYTTIKSGGTEFGIPTNLQPPCCSGKNALVQACSMLASGMPPSGLVTEWRASGPKIVSKKQEIQHELVVFR
jgi:hypothetical protein